MRLKGEVFRAHHPRWSYAPTSGEGAALYGGRFNPKGMAALYTSQRLQTAWLEAQQSFPYKAQPMTICTYRVNCDNMVDLTKATERRRFDIAIDDLDCPWEDSLTKGRIPTSWTVARKLYDAGMAGILVSSYATGAGEADVNVVFWRWSASRPHQVIVVDDFGRLPSVGK